MPQLCPQSHKSQAQAMGPKQILFSSSSNCSILLLWQPTGPLVTRSIVQIRRTPPINQYIILIIITSMEDVATKQDESPAAAMERARFQSLNRDRPVDFMGGCQLSFRERPPAPIAIESKTSVKDSPFFKMMKKK